ncbi:hypothetical protein [Acidovorax sp. Leaf160]|uniref:hypothetical protein n=1 Tax=Acidovorax sp. Leaf160 TaxID=1736280 RepID=UPI0006FEFBBF|nr:hypothetical protein [Acidovorax sp. Leaf160]KQR62662.1 hypothetical protein ASF94_15705 [Acidovorax sp. Leaf160]
MAITAPTPITAAPPVPDSGQPEPTFDAQYEAFNTWERQQLVPGANALAQVTYQNALEAKAAKDGTDGAVQIAIEKASQADQSRSAAQAAAVAAAEQVTLAGNAAGQAEASRIEASKINLGAKASAPTVDNQGQALRVGATYYDTTLNKLRAWTGTTWADSVNVTAGVKSLNGESGDLVKTTLAGYGLTDAMAKTTALAAGANLNAVLTPGFYLLGSTYTNGLAGFEGGHLIVSAFGSTAIQLLVSSSNGNSASRGVSGIGGTAVFTPWRRDLKTNSTPVAMTDSTIRTALGDYFTDTVSANKSYSFDNGLSAASFAIEITHTGGAIAWPGFVVWRNGTAPSGLMTGRRHLFFFQLAADNTRYYGSCIENLP